MNLLLSDDTSRIHVYIYDGSNLTNAEIEERLAKVMQDKIIYIVVGKSNLHMSCNLIKCPNCPLNGYDKEGHECFDTAFYINRYPSLLDKHPELLV